VSTDSPIHLEPEGDSWKVVIGPFKDVALARHVAQTLKELGEGGVNLLQVAAIPGAVLCALSDVEGEIGDGGGQYELIVEAGPRRERTAICRKSRTYRGRRRTDNP
jgi:hypothetical protein